jgi:hypothetical protein
MMKGVCKNKLNFSVEFREKKKKTDDELNSSRSCGRIDFFTLASHKVIKKTRGKLSYNSRDYHFPIENP